MAQSEPQIEQEKAKLRLNEVKYVGHVLSAEGVKADPEKVAAILDVPRPTCVKEVQKFTGFINYLSKFLPHLSEICEPLRRLTQKDAEWCWESQQEKAFQECKRLVTIQPVLKYYDAKVPVTIQCDSSDKGLGATLLQEGQPIAFAARALTAAEQNYAVIEKECLAICFACDKFHQYLMCRDSIKVESDHKPLEIIFRKNILAAPKRLQRMLLRLQKYQLQVCHKAGSSMYIADFLSRIKLSLNHSQVVEQHQDVFYTTLEEERSTEHVYFTEETSNKIQRETQKDYTLQALKEMVLSGWTAEQSRVPEKRKKYWTFREEIGLLNGILYKGQKVIIPQSMRKEMLKKIHSSHLGIESCTRKAKDLIFWPEMYKDIIEMVQQCHVCAKYSRNQSKEPLETPSIPNRPWSKLAIDQFSFNGMNYIVTVDYYSDYFEIDRLHVSTSCKIIKALKNHFARFGIPEEIITDNGPNFVSQEFPTFTSRWDIRHSTSSPYHSQGNGKAESEVKIAKQLMRKAKETK